MSLATHEYEDMPGKATDIGVNTRETVMILRCKWCMKTPTKARVDGCVMHEIANEGAIQISVYNPDGITRFGGRKCVTCDGDIMAHWLRPADDHDLRGEYFCSRNETQFSQGIADPQWDVDDAIAARISAKQSAMTTANVPEQAE